MNAEEMVKRRADTTYCLAGWMVYCEQRMRENWREYRHALAQGEFVDCYRNIVRSDVRELRRARRVFKEF